MALLQPSTPPEAAPELDFHQHLKQRLSEGWRVKVDGPSGVQLVKPREMRTLDKVGLALGILFLFGFPPLGALLLVAVAVDYFFLTHEQREFLVRKPKD